jgi:TfoX/Sxy family transcriptional regulator of competence genes
MAYDEGLAARVRDILDGVAGLAEKRMFGGLAFMVGGNMCCGVVGDELMVRVGPDAHDDALTQAHARPMDFTGRPMKGMVYVAPAGLKTAKALSAWVKRGLTFARSLPKKK